MGANGCAYFPFEELCDRPLGAADYFGLFSKSLEIERVYKSSINLSLSHTHALLVLSSTILSVSI